MLQSAVRSDQRIVIYWPKSYLLVLFIIIVKAGVIPTKTDWNTMNLTRRYREKKKRKKERQKEEWQKKKKKEEKIPNFVSGVGALSIEIRTGNCSKLITLYNHFAVATEPKTTKPHWVSVCHCLWYQHVRQKSARKIAACRVSDWLRLATT